MEYQDAFRRAEKLKLEAVERIRTYAIQTGIARSRFAKDAGLGLNTLRDLFRAEWNPTPETVRALEKFIATHPPKAAAASSRSAA